MPTIRVKTKLGVKAQMLIPKAVRTVLGVKPGDELTFVIRGSDVRLVPAPSESDDLFADLGEWDLEADRNGYADL